MGDAPSNPRPAPVSDAAAPIDQTEFREALANLNLTEGGRVIVACSGGPDSMALVVLLRRWADEAGRNLHALIVDHSLRDGSAKEAAETSQRLDGLNVENTVLTHTGERPLSDVQAMARDLRYRLILDWMANAGEHALFVAHHQDDQAETFLLRLGRGSGIDGLSAMASVTRREGVTIYRPLLGFPKDRLVATVEEAGVNYAEDPSNQSDAFARVRLRDMMQALAAEGLTPDRLAGTARRMARAREALDALRDRHIDRHVTVHDAGYALVDLNALTEELEEVALRVLSLLVRIIGGRDYPPREAYVSALWEALRKPERFSGRTLAGVSASLRRGKLLLCREMASVSDSVSMVDGVIWDGRYKVSLRTSDTGLTVSALGASGIMQIKEAFGDALAALPKTVGPTLPAVWNGAGRVIAVPHLGLSSPKEEFDGDIAFLRNSGGIRR